MDFQAPDYVALATELDAIAVLADHAGNTTTAAHLHDRARRLRWAGATPPDDEELEPRWH